MDAMVVGIDVSKDQLDVAVRPTGESFVLKRTAAGIEDLVARLKDRSPALVAIEATGGFEAVVAAGLAGAGLPVVVVNPAQVRADLPPEKWTPGYAAFASACSGVM